MLHKLKVLTHNMPSVDPKVRAQIINKLLVEEKIDLFKGSEVKDFCIEEDNLLKLEQSPETRRRKLF